MLLIAGAAAAGGGATAHFSLLTPDTDITRGG